MDREKDEDLTYLTFYNDDVWLIDIFSLNSLSNHFTLSFKNYSLKTPKTPV